MDGIEIWGTTHKQYSFVVAADRLAATASYKKEGEEVQYIGNTYNNVLAAMEACEKMADTLNV